MRDFVEDDTVQEEMRVYFDSLETPEEQQAAAAADRLARQKQRLLVLIAAVTKKEAKMVNGYLAGGGTGTGNGTRLCIKVVRIWLP